MLYFSCSWDVTTNCCRWNVELEFLFLHLNANVHYNRASCQNSGDSVLQRKPQQGTDKLPSEEFRVFIGWACRIINSSHFQFSYANQSPCCFLPCQVLASFMISHLFTHCYFTNSQRDKTHVQYFLYSQVIHASLHLHRFWWIQSDFVEFKLSSPCPLPQSLSNLELALLMKK